MLPWNFEIFGRYSYWEWIIIVLLRFSVPRSFKKELQKANIRTILASEKGHSRVKSELKVKIQLSVIDQTMVHVETCIEQEL
jgi:hypothetical protein